MDFTVFVTAVFGGAGLVGSLVLMVLKRQMERDRLELIQLSEAVRRLESETFQELKQQLERHLREDNPGAVAVQITELGKAVNLLTAKVDRMAETIAEVKANGDNNRDFTRNLYTSMQKLREEIHHGK